MAWLTGWSYRKEITITGQSGAGTNYQVKLDIGDSAGGNFHLEGHCTNFPQDIEVTDNDGTTLLKFWIVDLTADPLRMWIKVADDLGSNQTIYIYYGKSGATTNSSGPDTFLAFFDGDSSGWTEVDGGSDIAFTNDRLEFTNLQRNVDGYVYKSFARASDNFTFEYVWNVTTNNSGQIVYLPSMTNSVDDLRNQQNHYSSGRVVNVGVAATIEISDSSYVGNTITFTHNTTYYNTVTRVSNTITTKIYTNSAKTNLLGTTTVTQATIPSLSYLFLMSNYNSGDPNAISGWIDDFFVREYLATEPAFSSAGSEETEHIHTYDTAARVAPNDLDPMTVSVTPTTGATVLVLAIMTGSSNGRTGGAPTFNGVALTQIESMISGTNEITVEMWYLINPSIGTYNVSVPNTFNKDIALNVSVYKARAGYTSAFDVSDSNTSGSTQNTSITVTPTVNGDVIVEAMGHGYSTIPSANNRTKLYSVDEGVWTDNHQYALQDTAAAIEFTWTVGGFDDLAQILVAFKEVTIPITGHPWYYERRQ